MTTDAAVSSRRTRRGAVAVVVAGLVAVWYLVAVPLNGAQLEDLYARIDPDRSFSFGERLSATWDSGRPMLPTPDLIAADFWTSATEAAVTSKRNILYHAAVTTGATVLGFALGALMGVALAVGLVHLRTLDASLMPWLIASQTIPILAIAPMLLAVLGTLGLTGLAPKAAIAMYLCFFPVTVGMVKGLRAPDRLALDLMRTYSASGGQVLAKLRFPTAMPYLFASLKVAIALGLVGTMVAELSTGGQAGLGGRLLTASYNGDMVHMWTALVTSSVLAILLVWAVGLAERAMARSTGALRPGSRA
ncbi:MAG: ABC transporter permease [Alphaproteobacteria bacterium]